MLSKIITVPFDNTLHGFDDKIISDFCHNKKIYKLKTGLINRENSIYWTCFIIYDEIIGLGDRELPQLTEPEQALYNKIREWRRNLSDKKGFPAYMVCNNAHLRQIVQNKCVTLESLKQIKGFGKAKISEYGKEIIDIVKTFYEQQKAGDKPPLKPPEEQAT